eukprot:6179637-Pleurochrysis_carterae.AAC.1
MRPRRRPWPWQRAPGGRGRRGRRASRGGPARRSARPGALSTEFSGLLLPFVDGENPAYAVEQGCLADGMTGCSKCRVSVKSCEEKCRALNWAGVAAMKSCCWNLASRRRG